jgi:hypothetical protein
MSILGILIGILNCVLLVAVLVLVGAIIVWVAQIFEWPIPWNIQRIYLLICLLVFIICASMVIAGQPMVHFFGKLGTLPFPIEGARALSFGQQLVSPRQLA